jgi:hypothetical protein
MARNQSNYILVREALFRMGMSPLQLWKSYFIYLFVYLFILLCWGSNPQVMCARQVLYH